mmetsp:Transcript_77901/g.209088  ORF Transcript_77901/g.209088 Transcript_77901/m.209088 type:complete len:238 (-) Transcript_77901:2-715(-)
MRHLDLLVYPIQRIKHPVPPQHDDVQVGTPILSDALTITEDVLRHHREPLDELRESPQDLEHRVVAGQQKGCCGTRHQDNCQIAGIIPAIVGFIKHVEKSQNKDGGEYVRQLKEHEVVRLSMVEQIQIPRDEDQEVQYLRASRQSRDGLVLGDGQQHHDNAEEVEVVTNVAEDVPRVGREAGDVGRAVQFVHRIHRHGCLGRHESDVGGDSCAPPALTPGEAPACCSRSQTCPELEP